MKDMSRVALFLLTWPFWLVGVPWTCLLRFSALKRVTTLQIYPTVCSEIHILLLCMGGIYYCISSNNVFMAAAFPPSLPVHVSIQPTAWWGCFFNPCWWWEHLRNIHYYWAWLDGFLVVEFVEWHSLPIKLALKVCFYQGFGGIIHIFSSWSDILVIRLKEKFNFKLVG